MLHYQRSCYTIRDHITLSEIIRDHVTLSEIMLHYQRSCYTIRDYQRSCYSIRDYVTLSEIMLHYQRLSEIMLLYQRLCYTIRDLVTLSENSCFAYRTVCKRTADKGHFQRNTLYFQGIFIVCKNCPVATSSKGYCKTVEKCYNYNITYCLDNPCKL